jgi:phosphatidylglycerophosphatase A
VRATLALATWFGCGRIPLAPGTAGTLGAVPLYLVLRPHGPRAVLAAACLLTAVGTVVAGRVARRTGARDPQFVVIDEVAGVHFAWAAAPPTRAGLVLGFVLFRIFDQWKPFPARWIEHALPPGPSIVLDDVAAGLWSAAVMAVCRAVRLV